MKVKTIIGIILIIASIAGMYYWESSLRQNITYVDVLVPSRDISALELISPDDFKTMKINPEALIKGALRPNQLDEIEGKLCLYPVFCNQQLEISYFKPEYTLEATGYRNFVIPFEWIHSFSVYLSEGDYADFYSLPNEEFIGTYKIDILNQEDGYFRMEISTSLEEYYKIFESHSLNENTLLITTEKRTWDM